MVENTDEILRRYKEEISKKINFDDKEYFPDESFSIEYKTFRKENLEKNLSRYENFCNFSERILKVSPNKKDIPLINESINRLQLEITPEGAMSFAVLVGLSIIYVYII